MKSPVVESGAVVIAAYVVAVAACAAVSAFRKTEKAVTLVALATALVLTGLLVRLPFRREPDPVKTDRKRTKRRGR
jgi:hypothetical protein